MKAGFQHGLVSLLHLIRHYLKIIELFLNLHRKILQGLQVIVKLKFVNFLKLNRLVLCGYI